MTPLTVEEQAATIQRMMERVAGDVAARGFDVDLVWGVTLNRPLYDHLQSLPFDALPAFARENKVKVNDDLLTGCNDISVTSHPKRGAE